MLNTAILPRNREKGNLSTYSTISKYPYLGSLLFHIPYAMYLPLFSIWFQRPLCECTSQCETHLMLLLSCDFRWPKLNVISSLKFFLPFLPYIKGNFILLHFSPHTPISSRVIHTLVSHLNSPTPKNLFLFLHCWYQLTKPIGCQVIFRLYLILELWFWI